MDCRGSSPEAVAWRRQGENRHPGSSIPSWLALPPARLVCAIVLGAVMVMILILVLTLCIALVLLPGLERRRIPELSLANAPVMPEGSDEGCPAETLHPKPATLKPGVSDFSSILSELHSSEIPFGAGILRVRAQRNRCWVVACRLCNEDFKVSGFRRPRLWCRNVQARTVQCMNALLWSKVRSSSSLRPASSSSSPSSPSSQP